MQFLLADEELLLLVRRSLDAHENVRSTQYSGANEKSPGYLFSCI